MVQVSTIGQKIKGEAQQVKGAIEDKMGHPVHGAIDKLRGKANVLDANIKDKIDDHK